MTIKNITVAGGGTLGSQIAWQSAFKGFNVIIYDAFDKGIAASQSFHKQFSELFIAERGATIQEIEQALNRISYTTNLAEAVKDADLISESVPENIEIKNSFYKELNKVAPKKTIFTTNSSSMVPSMFVKATGRPKQFLAMHFANGIWDANVAEIMGTPETDEVIFNQVVAFAKAIDMVPIILKKEQPGYVLNSLLIPLLTAATALLANDVSDPYSIDKTWMISTGVKLGPFAIMDMVGLETLYNILKGLGEQPKHKDLSLLADFIKTQYVDKGHLGVKSGQGFYTYPNPKFMDSDFLS
ncbi:3-hydroxyacyl-CoA dehydrogenase [Formosa sp. PL04]|uniref:3-hydroxyacyl-CoA dehydrogenase n=1 Tax=Formosa sp. PL04 TaxID=3081755 RepID=UPI002980A991|nr:3-hydroxyacyl-CoA dehydrogenase [Formosa sp. PL04]MDW5289647.1 3-hydroxyacyl-CoA dehydrogenase [Formosa sp. PL04]